ncbi:MAG: hypothetical protein GY839_20490 [candidate division Zixibacteria bacterium]|nr:hypothetical protein [candidate division Zixibacteria bacterium]
MRRAVAVILVLLVAGIAYAGGDISLAIPGMGTTGPYRLNHTHIIVDSESITLKGGSLSKIDDYRIEYNDGFIVLTEPLALTDTLQVRFSIVPLLLKRSYHWLRPVAATDIDTAINQPASRPYHRGSRLDIIGSKGFAINIGNIGEPSLTQSLDLDISGEISRGVRVKGSISDRNFGTSSSGGTSSLDELDKIFLSLEAKGFRGDFGDLELKGIDNSLLDFRRKLTGLNLSGTTDGFHGSSALAFSPGKQIELFFYGIDGKQGPYILNSPEISSSLILGNTFLPGTEEVYLDGNKLKRGNENDYEIDYYERFIEFTPKNIISSKSRVTIKIQFAPEGYRKSFYHGNTFRDGGISVGIQYVGEKDDKSNPRNFELGEPERLAIGNAGAFQDSSYSSGAKLVGAGNGDYILSSDTAGVSFYEYIGLNQGDYQVVFSRVGQGRGDYEYIGEGRYLYVGELEGVYLPIIYYPLPESRDHGSIMINRSGDFYFDGELAVSRYDRNTLSGKDELFDGLGLLGTLGYKTEINRFIGKTWKADILNLRVRSLDEQFSAPGIIDPPEFFRRYNIPRIRSITGEKLIEFQSGVTSESGENIKAGGGFFNSGEFEASRGFGLVNLMAPNKIRISAKAELTRSEDKDSSRVSDWNKYDAGFEFTGGVFRPGGVYRHELNDGLLSFGDSFKSDEYEAFLTLFPATVLSTKSKLLYRKQHNRIQDDTDAEIWRNQYNQYQFEQGVSYGNPGFGLNGELRLSRLFQNHSYPTEEKIIRNMGDMKINYGASNYGLTFYESVNGTGQVSRAREYIFVGDGKGDFRKDGEDYVPEPDGDYIEVIRQLGELETDTGLQTGYEISGGFRIRLDRKALAREGILARISYDNDFTHRTNLASGARIRAKHFSPLSKFDQNEMTLRLYNYRQRATFKFNQAGDYLRHTLKSSQSDGTDFQFESLNNKTLANSADLKIFTRQTVSLLVSTELASETRWLYSGNVDLERIKTRLVPEIHPAAGVKIEIPFEYADEDEKVNDVRILTYSIGLRSVFNFRSIGRLEFDGAYTNVDTDRENVFIPYVTAGGRKKGDNYNGLISARFKVNSYSRIELRYSYRKLGDGYSNNNLRLEAKAEF